MEKFKSFKNKPKAQWSLLNNLAGQKQLCHPPKAPLDQLTTAFASIVDDPTRPPALTLPRDDSTCETYLAEFQPVSPVIIENLLKTLNAHKSPGSDGVPPCFLKNCSQAIIGPLTAIVNQSLRTGKVPTSYKHAHICPIFKSGDPTVATNYRPISLLPIASKVLEKIVHKQLTSFFASNTELSALPTEQFAYRAHHSCEDALVLAIDRWHGALDSNDACGVVFANMTKAFDRVQHVKLINELHSIGIRSTALNWFADYLTARQQQVVIDRSKGNKTECTRGVPQGSVLGPLLFCLYIREVPAVFTFSKCLIYADDICFFVSHRDQNVIVSQLNDDLSSLNSFLEDRGLLLNPAKTNFMMVRRPTVSLVSDDLHLHCRGVDIATVPSTKYLGVIVDVHLTFREQVENVCAKVNKKLGSFKHGRRNLTAIACRLFLPVNHSVYT